MDIRAVGKRSVEWDLNDWKWDGDLFVARQLNHHGSSNSSSSCFDGGNVERRRKEMENKKKKTRAVPVIAMEEGNLRDDEDAPGLTLKLGGENADNAERNDARKTKFGGGIPNRAVCCQVENCVADLSKVKDYHRRHKVCEMHSKATSALVGGIMQRFCQQCSRFHVLEEFDEGKRSCRRRLAGHNKRRRKPNPDTIGNGNPLSDDQTSNYLLITLLKILSNIHSNQLDHSGDQDLLSHLLKSLVSQPGEQIGKNLVGLLQGGGGLQASQNIGNVLPFLSIKQAPREDVKQHSVNVPETPWQEVYANAAQETVAPYRSEKQVKMNDFDLNDIYIDLDGTTDVERSLPPPTNPATSSLHYHLDSRQSSPPQISNNSDSASDRSPSSSSGDAQGRTDRIVFKLFGKAPNDFPVALRGQILDWLTHSPTDIESYIRPGCIVLTIYVHQDEASWEELCCDLSFSLSRLLDLSDDPLWTDGWIYVRVQNQLAFAFNGQVVLDTYLPLRSHDYSQIITITPLAVSRKAQFTVKGINLRRPGTRLLCAVEGAYLVQEATPGMMEERDDLKEKNEIEFFTFSCEMPVASGRGFMEIEDQDGLSSSFFPFIVSEDEDVCSEIRRLESTLEFTGTDSAMQAMDFIHEIGWLLHRNELKPRAESDPNSKDLFPLVRLKFLIEFSMDREWCAVMKKLLNILFEEGTIDSSPDVALTELCLLHRAVRKNSKPMVEMLLRFIPKKKNQTLSEFFRPDAAGPAGLTPLHIAAGKDGSEDVLDALTEDPGMIGIQAWKLSRDNTGFTPEDYARLRGHFSYIHLVQRKVNGKPIHKEHVVVNIPESLHIDHKQEKKQCKLCDHKRTQHRSVAYRPAMLSMVAIAAVCVCVALLFKSCPEVIYVFQPFRWELLEYGTS